MSDLVLLHSTSLWLSSHYSDVCEMADYTIASSVNIKTGNKVRNIVSNRLYCFNNKLTWKKRFSMKSYIQRNWHWKKWTMWPILSLTKLSFFNWSPNVPIRLCRAYPSRTGIWSPIEICHLHCSQRPGRWGCR